MSRVLLSGGLILNNKNEILLLYRDDHHHYETPGGKVEPEECTDFSHPTIDELAQTARREIFEELGKDISLSELHYFGKKEFTIPNGHEAIAHKFVTSIISGEPRINEHEKFSKLEYLPLSKLDEFPISPDLKLFMKELKKKYC
jgi:8-oxo-dGTP pyrophosphatase MutT (NUDIX family)